MSQGYCSSSPRVEATVIPSTLSIWFGSFLSPGLVFRQSIDSIWGHFGGFCLVISGAVIWLASLRPQQRWRIQVPEVKAQMGFGLCTPPHLLPTINYWHNSSMQCNATNLINIVDLTEETDPISPLNVSVLHIQHRYISDVCCIPPQRSTKSRAQEIERWTIHSHNWSA